MSSERKGAFFRKVIFCLSLPVRWTSYSLRVRLAFWYGTLIAVAFLFFILLILSFTMGALKQGAVRAVQTEEQVVCSQIQHELIEMPPYWPPELVLHPLNAYHYPGIAVEVRTLQGTTLYDSDKNVSTHIPFPIMAQQVVRAGRSVVYREHFGKEAMQVGAVPVFAPKQGGQGSSVIGVVLVAKSLRDVDKTITLLRSLLFLVGGVTLVGALFGGWVIVSYFLQPLTEVASTARAIADTTAQGTRIGNLSKRVKQPDGNDEIAQVVEAFNMMLTNLERAVQSQRRFVADASHELRAPLTTIQGNLAFLQQHYEELSSPERQTVLHDAYEEVVRLTQLVSELLLLARADAHMDTALTPQRSEIGGPGLPLIDLDRVALHTVRQTRLRLAAEESALKLEFDCMEPVQVRGDEESLRRILLILLDNALKYTPPSIEQDRGRIVVSVKRQEQEAVLSVSDTGIGIEAQELPRIFERFYRSDHVRSRQGTGLGLPIAQALAEQGGGRIIVESTPGQGSTFYLHLPLA
jgi:two-component system OmpR family sensor kinase